jgi:hypothetical protein
VIVKEKLIAGERRFENDKTVFVNLADQPELLTVMIKRDPGFNPEAGDWEFLVYEGNGETITARGVLQNCMECHIRQVQSDFVFRNYRPDASATLAGTIGSTGSADSTSPGLRLPDSP